MRPTLARVYRVVDSVGVFFTRFAPKIALIESTPILYTEPAERVFTQKIPQKNKPSKLSFLNTKFVVAKNLFSTEDFRDLSFFPNYHYFFLRVNFSNKLLNIPIQNLKYVLGNYNSITISRSEE